MADSGNKNKATSGANITITNQMMDPTTPVPFKDASGSSVFSYTVKGKKYIPFLGPQDNFPTQLLEARLTSTTQNACITTIVESLVGQGVFVKDVKPENVDTKLMEFFGCVNNREETIDDILKSCGDGFFQDGNKMIEIVKGDLAGTKWLKIYAHPIMFCRVGQVDAESGIAKTIIISKSFTRNGYISNLKDQKELPIYNRNVLDKEKNWKPDEGNASIQRTMIHLKNEMSGLDYYGLPPSIAGLRYQTLEGNAAQYNIDNFDNNMVLGGMLIFKGAMTQQEANANAKEILISHVGKGKTGRIAVISSENGLDDVEFKEYKTQKEGSFIELDKRIEEKIVAANGWDRRLAGLDRDGGMSNGDMQLSSIYDMKETTLLNPVRKRIIDKVLLPILKIWSEHTGNKAIEKYQFGFKNELPLSFFGKIDPETFVKVKEARKASNLEEDTEKGEKYLCEMKAKAQPLQQDGGQQKGGGDVPS